VGAFRIEVQRHLPCLSGSDRRRRLGRCRRGRSGGVRLWVPATKFAAAGRKQQNYNDKVSLFAAVLGCGQLTIPYSMAHMAAPARFETPSFV
jgi:hypothetical protein